MNKIDIEAHFSTKDFVDHMRSRKEPPREELEKTQIREWLAPNLSTPRSFAFEDKLLELGEARIKAMDAASIDIQVLSLVVPGCEQFGAEGLALAKKINNEIARVIKKYPNRFVGLTSLAPQEPEGAAKELERAVKELGFKGVHIDSNIGGDYLDNKKYWPIFQKAESLEVPIYIHPGAPSSCIVKPYADYGIALSGPPLGFGAETALHAMRLILSGVFDKYPGLRIVLGHLGEALPFWLDRIDFFWLKPWAEDEIRPRIAMKPSDYVKRNFFVTTSGMSFMPSLICAYLALGADRIIFASDYPFEDALQASKAVDAMPICNTDKDKIFRHNAERLFKLKM